MKNLLLCLSLGALSLSSWADEPFKVISPVTVEDGSTVYLVNYDTGEKVDSALVSEKSVVFTGTIDEPYVARLIAGNGTRLGTFILEGGTLAINPQMRRGVGSMLNDQFNVIQDSINSIGENYNNAEESQREAILEGYKNYLNQQITENIDNPIGYLLFLDMAYEMPAQEMMDYVAANPELQNYRRVSNLLNSAERKLQTSPGKKMVDFEATYNGKTERLSDYVGKGDYVLVDFWASWCGPCVREIKNLKEINEEFGPKGLKVLGVAVWDKPEDTQGAIDRLQIPWHCILNTQNAATDVYGIPAIPCIILFGPDGTILARDVVGADLKRAVANALEQKD